MRMLNSKKKKIGATTLVLCVIGGGAFAYWTTDGSGNGAGTTGTTQAITVHQTSTVTGLAPGATAQPLSGNFDNPNDSSVFVAAVTATVSDVTDGDGVSIADDCATNNYAITGTASVGAQVPVGDGVGSWSGLSLSMANTAQSQDACKGATVVIAYTVS